jgi:hypothetical protein
MPHDRMPDAVCDGIDMGQSCINSAAGGDCKTYETEYATGCGSSVKTLDKTCGDLVTAINFMCGNGSVSEPCGFSAYGARLVVQSRQTTAATAQMAPRKYVESGSRPSRL